MIHLRNKNIDQELPTVVTIGNFDGMHKGHIKLIKSVINHAKRNNLKSLVFSFNPHPRSVIKEEKVYHIFTSEEKARTLSQLGVDIFIEYPFDREFSIKTPQYFMEEIIYKKLKCAALAVGENYRFGKNGEGNITHILDFSKKHGIHIFVENLQKEENGENICSTKIRKAITDGEIVWANNILGRSYYIEGLVLEGDKRGSQIGFPTANIAPHPTKILPKNGVYITSTVLVDSATKYPSVTNIGVHPTFEGSNILIETFILDFKQNIYNKNIGINFLQRIRNEKKFDNVNSLVRQIKLDVDMAREWHNI